MLREIDRKLSEKQVKTKKHPYSLPRKSEIAYKPPQLFPALGGRPQGCVLECFDFFSDSFRFITRTDFRTKLIVNCKNKPIWMKLGGHASYKPPGAYYTAQGPQKQPEILKNLLFVVKQLQNFQKNNNYILFKCL